MNKNKIRTLLIVIITIIIVIIALLFVRQKKMEEDKMMIRVAGWDMEYNSSSRKLTIEDFESIELGSSLDEIENRLGKPDGWVGGGILSPVYILEDKTAVELIFENNVTDEDLEAIYLYKGNQEFLLKKK